MIQDKHTINRITWLPTR